MLAVIATGWITCLSADPDWLYKQVAINPGLNGTVDSVLLETEAKAGVTLDASPALSGEHLVVRVKSRTVQDLISGIAALYRCNVRITRGKDGRPDVYLWYHPDRLSEAKRMRNSDRNAYEKRTFDAFQSLREHRSPEIRDEIKAGYQCYNLVAASLLGMFPPERQRQIIRSGMEPIPFADLPGQVQDSIAQNMSRAWVDRDYLRRTGQNRYVDSRKRLQFVQLGFKVLGEGSQTKLFLATKDLTEDEPGYPHDLPAPTFGVTGNLMVGWTRWTHGQFDLGFNYRQRRSSLQGANTLTSLAKATPLPASLQPIVHELEGNGDNGPHACVRLFLAAAEAFEADTLFSLWLTVPRGPGALPFFTFPSNRTIESTNDLLEHIGARTGYGYGYAHRFLLWRHCDWFHHDVAAVSEPLLNHWNKRKESNHGALPLLDLAKMAACTDDQLDRLLLRSWTEPKMLAHPVFRALFVLLDSLGPTDRSAALGKAGVRLDGLSDEQLQVLAIRSHGMDSVCKAVQMNKRIARMRIREEGVGRRRKVRFLFDWGKSVTPVTLKLNDSP